MKMTEYIFPGIYIKFQVMLDSYVVTHGRQVYGILDLIGDIGGLADGLIAVSSILVWFLQLFIGSEAQKYLLSSLF